LIKNAIEALNSAPPPPHSLLATARLPTLAHTTASRENYERALIRQATLEPHRNPFAQASKPDIFEAIPYEKQCRGMRIFCFDRWSLAIHACTIVDRQQRDLVLAEAKPPKGLDIQRSPCLYTVPLSATHRGTQTHKRAHLRRRSRSGSIFFFYVLQPSSLLTWRTAGIIL